MAVDDEAPLTISVPEAGKKYFNLSRDGSYAAAERGKYRQLGWGGCYAFPCGRSNVCSTSLPLTPSDAA